MAKVLIIEDDATLAETMAFQLRRVGYDTITAPDGRAGLRRFHRERPDLIILDLMLPEIDGWRVLESVRQEDTRIPVLVCSARTSEHDAVHGLEIGADDYIAKPFRARELVARVKANLRRVQVDRSIQGGTALVAGPLTVDPAQFQAYLDGRSVGLTAREFEVLHALAREMGRPLTREEIYRRVWGYERHHGDRSVDVFVRKLRRKLEGAAPATRFIHTHYGVGYTFEARPAAEAPTT